jgi:uncharacterized protein
VDALGAWRESTENLFAAAGYRLPFKKRNTYFYTMQKDIQVIEQTKKWINDVVIGCNFCPFAANVVKQQRIFYRVEPSSDVPVGLGVFMEELTQLDEQEDIETSFIIFPEGFAGFQEYLDLVAMAEKLLKKHGYEGIYQVASFHPEYRFADAPEDDAANYTNRSPHPMLHLLREESIDRALEHYKDPDSIPDRNIHFAREKGIVYMKMLRDACMAE